MNGKIINSNYFTLLCDKEAISRKKLVEPKILKEVNFKIKFRKPIVFIPSDVRDEELKINGKKEYRMVMFGATEDKQYATVIIKGIMPYFDIKVPKRFGSDIKGVNKFLKVLMKEVKCHSRKIIRGKYIHEYCPENNRPLFVRLFYKRLLDRNIDLGILKDKYQTVSNLLGKKFYRQIAALKQLELGTVMELNKYDVSRYERYNALNTRQFEIDIDDIKLKPDEDADGKNLIMSWDIETYGSINPPVPEHKDSELIMISCAFTFEGSDEPAYNLVINGTDTDVNKNTLIIKCNGEVDILKIFAQVFEVFRPNFVMGFNDGTYDWKWIYEIAQREKLLPFLYRKMSVRKYNEWAMNKVDFRYFYISKRIKISADAPPAICKTIMFPGYVNIDVQIAFLKAIGGKADRYISLNSLLKKYLLPNKVDMSIYVMFTTFLNLYKGRNHLIQKAKLDAEKYKDAMQKMSKAVEYCLVDSISCYRLMLKENVLLKYRKMSSKVYMSISDIYHMANSCKIDNMVYAIANKNGILSGYIPFKSPMGTYSGAFVVPPKKGLKRVVQTINELMQYANIEHKVDYINGLIPKIIEKHKPSTVDRVLCDKNLIQFDKYCELITTCKTKTQLREKLVEIRETNNVWKRVTQDEEKLMIDIMVNVGPTILTDDMDEKTLSETIKSIGSENALNALNKFKLLEQDKKHVYFNYLNTRAIRPTSGLDFKSLYPSIMIAYNLSPEKIIFTQEEYESYKNLENWLQMDARYKDGTIVKMWVARSNDPKTGEIIRKKMGIFPLILSDFMIDRDSLKKRLKADKKTRKHILDQIQKGEIKENDEIKKELTDLKRSIANLDATQLAVKVLMNSFYGVLGNVYSFLYSPNIGAAVTHKGQALIKITMDYVQTNGYKVMYGDTDSTYVASPDHLFKTIDWEYQTGQITKEQYYIAVIKIAIETVTKFSIGLNKMFQEVTGTKKLIMVFEEVLFPLYLLVKKKYFGVQNEKVEHIKVLIDNISEIFTRGLDSNKRDSNQIYKIHNNNIIVKIMNINEIRDIVDIVIDEYSVMINKNWTYEDVVAKQKFKLNIKEGKYGIFMQKQIRAGRAGHLKPGMTYKWLVAKKPKYNLKGSLSSSQKSVSSRMVFLEEAEERNLPIDVDHYLRDVGNKFGILISSDILFNNIETREVGDDTSNTSKADLKRIQKVRQDCGVAFIKRVFANHDEDELTRLTIIKKKSGKIRIAFKKLMKIKFPGVNERILLSNIVSFEVDSLVDYSFDDAVKHIINKSKHMTPTEKMKVTKDTDTRLLQTKYSIGTKKLINAEIDRLINEFKELCININIMRYVGTQYNFISGLLQNNSVDDFDIKIKNNVINVGTGAYKIETFINTHLDNITRQFNILGRIRELSVRIHKWNVNRYTLLKAQISAKYNEEVTKIIKMNLNNNELYHDISL